jgi:hypothetical protein
MPTRHGRRADDILLMALTCGATVEVAAGKAGVSAATAYRRLQELVFGRRLQNRAVTEVRFPSLSLKSARRSLSPIREMFRER